MRKTLKVTGIGLLMMVSLNSCWFNSAGAFFRQGSYKAQANIMDVEPGQYVYSDGSKYYVELPRYRVAKKYQVLYSVHNEKERPVEVVRTSGSDLYEIPADFAMYLIGRANYPDRTSDMNRVLPEDEDELRASLTQKYSIVRPKSDNSFVYHFQYNSPNAAWWYTAGVFEALCIDLPMSVAVNCAGAWAYLLYARDNPPGGSGGGGSDSSPQYYDGHGHYWNTALEAEHSQREYYNMAAH